MKDEYDFSKGKRGAVAPEGTVFIPITYRHGIKQNNFRFKYVLLHKMILTLVKLNIVHKREIIVTPLRSSFVIKWG